MSTREHPIEGLNSRIRRALQGQDAPAYHVHIDAIAMGGKLIDQRTQRQLDLKDGTAVVVRLDAISALVNNVSVEPRHVPFLPKETRIFYGGRKRHITDMIEGLKVWDEGFVPLFSLDTKHPLRLHFRMDPSEYLWMELVLEENLWLISRDDRPAKLLPCGVRVPALEQKFPSLNAAVTECVRACQPTRLSTATNVFRSCLVVEGGRPGLLMWVRDRVVFELRNNPKLIGFPDEPHFGSIPRLQMDRSRRLGKG